MRQIECGKRESLAAVTQNSSHSEWQCWTFTIESYRKKA